MILAALITYAILAGGIFYFVMETGKRSGEPSHQWFATAFVLASTWPLITLVVGALVTTKAIAIMLKKQSIN